MEKNTIKMGDFIRTAREAARLTQAELAKEAKTTTRTITDLERDKRLPTYEVFYRIIHVLGVSADHIFWPEKTRCTSEQEQLIRAVQSCDQQEQTIFMDIAWAYIRALNRER